MWLSVLFLYKGATLVNNRAHGPYTLVGSPAWGPVLNPLVAYTLTTVYVFVIWKKVYNFFVIYGVGLKIVLRIVCSNQKQLPFSSWNCLLDESLFSKTSNLFCVMLMDFLPLIKRVSQFLIKGQIFLERERGREKDTFFFLSLNLSHCHSQHKFLSPYCKPSASPQPTNMQGQWAWFVSQVRWKEGRNVGEGAINFFNSLLSPERHKWVT